MIIDAWLGSSNETIKRSVVKSVSWRLLGTLDTILISYVVTGRAGTALSIGSIELITKMALYVAHERVWDRCRWGRAPVSGQPLSREGVRS